MKSYENSCCYKSFQLKKNCLPYTASLGKIGIVMVLFLVFFSNLVGNDLFCFYDLEKDCYRLYLINITEIDLS